MFLLRDLHFMFCSRDLNVLCVQRIMGFLSYSSYYTSSENLIKDFDLWGLKVCPLAKGIELYLISKNNM